MTHTICATCNGNTYIGRIGFDERTCQHCAGNGFEPSAHTPTRIPTEAQYLAREADRLYRQLQEVENAPLQDRREARAEYAQALGDIPLLIQRLEWLLEGCYGKGAHVQAWRIVNGTTRSNKPAQLALLLAALEWQCPRAFAVDAWKTYTNDRQAEITKAIEATISAAVKAQIDAEYGKASAEA